MSKDFRGARFGGFGDSGEVESNFTIFRWLILTCPVVLIIPAAQQQFVVCLRLTLKNDEYVIDRSLNAQGTFYFYYSAARREPKALGLYFIFPLF